MIQGDELVVVLSVLLVAPKLVTLGFYCEALGLVILALLALVGGVVLGNSKLQGLQSRPGGGIVLGLVTWPLIFASRLQLGSRSSDHQFFWIALVCSLRLLVFMCHIRANELRDTVFERLEIFSSPTMNQILVWSLRVMLWFAGFESISILPFDVFTKARNYFFLFCGFIACVFLAWLTGFRNISVLPFTAFASSELLKSVFLNFPGSATLGEGSLVASGLSMYIGNIIVHALRADSSGNRDIVVTMLEVAVISLCLMPWIYKCFLRCTRNSKSVSLASSIVFIVVVFAPCWFWLVTGLRQHPVFWVMDFMMEQPLERFGLCVYWLSILLIVPFLYHVAGRVPQILLRKAYHLLAVAMFVPALLWQAKFLQLAFTVSLVVFVLAEMIRVWQIPTLSQKVNDFMCAFTDGRDSDKLIISHFTLLLGCALPVWLHAHMDARPLAPFAGVMSVGIGDTMASFIGYNFGSWRLGNTNKKTVEGTIAGITSLILSCALVLFLLPGCAVLSQLPVVMMASLVAGLVEAYTLQLDNVFVPLVFYSLLCL